jgi:anaerobic selenocysteine-containing dehydrogenase
MNQDTPHEQAEIVPSTCWECGTLCGSLMTVEAGVVTKIAPNPAHPASKGAFCVKGMRAIREWTYQDSRLKTPLRRVGPRGSGAFEPVTWDAALDEIADRLATVRREHGARAIAGATNGAFFSRGLMMALLMRSIGSPNWMVNQDLCGGCRAVADQMTGLGIGGGEDIDNTACALVVGRNPAVADPIQWMALKRAKVRGARIIVIDPLRTSAAEIADLWLRPRPGTDTAVALAIIRTMIGENLYDRGFVQRWCHGFDALAERVASCTPDWAAQQSGVPAADIVQAARWYAAGPSCFVSGHGIDASSTGVQTFRAYFIMVAIAGNVDRVGGNRRAKKPPGFKTNFDVLFDPAFRLPPEIEDQRIGAQQFPLWAGPLGYQMACHNPSVITAILTGEPYKVRALFASGANILLTYPDVARTVAALQSLDVFVVASQYLTPTAAWADFVLPKTTTLEEEEVTLHQAGPCVTYTAPGSARHGEPRPDIEIAGALIERMAARDALHAKFLPWRDQSEFVEYLLAETDIDPAALKRTGFHNFAWSQGDLERQTIATPSGKFELYSQEMARAGVDPLPAHIPPAHEREAPPVQAAYPLVLQTGLREKTYHHSRFREQSWARKISADPIVYVHPATAQEYRIVDGDWITVSTPRTDGTCSLRSKVSETTMQGVLTTGMGWWLPEAPAPWFGAREVNISGAMSYSGPFDAASGSADTRAIACRIVAVAASRDL